MNMRPFVPIFFCALLAGCTGLVAPRGQVAIYTLAPWPVASSSDAATVHIAATLAVELPQAHGLLSGPDLLVSPAPQRLAVYADARWDEPPARLLRTRMLAALRARGFAGALPAGSGALPHWQLESELHRFDARVHDRHAQAEVVLEARLLDASTRRLMGQQRFAVAWPAAGTGATQLVAALDHASDTLATQVAQWSAQVLAQSKQVPATGH